MTRLILCPPTATAVDRLNDAREITGKMRTERKRNGNHTERYRELHDSWVEAATDVVQHILEGAVYTDEEPDPRVAALVSYARGLEDRYVRENGYTEHWTDADADAEVMYNRKDAGVTELMEASDGE